MGVCIIAEAGVNHNGSFIIAKKMIEAAKEAGADYIKFQTFVPENLVTQNAVMAQYQIKNSKKCVTQIEMLKKLTLTKAEFIKLKEYCEELKIGFLSSPFDNESIEFLKELGMDIWKIPSGEITNLPYIEKIANIGEPVILSTGMSTLKEIEEAIALLEKNRKTTITLLHCNTQYPTPYEDVNLLAMNSLREYFNLPVGYSDHTLGIEVPIAAVSIGASVIEKHFTLDKEMIGPDHLSSLDVNELKAMVKAIRNIEKSLGSALKEPSGSELSNKDIVRKSIVARTDIKEGDIFTEDNITVKRPGTGISPMMWHEIIGKKAIRNFKEDEFIEI